MEKDRGQPFDSCSCCSPLLPYCNYNDHLHFPCLRDLNQYPMHLVGLSRFPRMFPNPNTSFPSNSSSVHSNLFLLLSMILLELCALWGWNVFLLSEVLWDHKVGILSPKFTWYAWIQQWVLAFDSLGRKRKSAFWDSALPLLLFMYHYTSFYMKKNIE